MANNYYKKLYTDENLDSYLDHLNHRWLIPDNGKLMRHEFRFKNFSESMKFVNSIAKIAEKENHHPDMTISYNRVLIELTTHEEGKLTRKDFLLAKKIEEILE